MTVADPAERVQARLRRWLDTTGLSQREFAADLQRSQVWLQKVLAGKIRVTLKDLDRVARAMRTTASELVRTEEERYQLELTPTELRLLEALRRRPEAYESLFDLMHLPPLRDRAKHEARRTPPRPGIAKL